MMYYIILFFISLFLLAKLLWILYKRKYKGIDDLPGPKEYPFIGNLLDFGIDNTGQWNNFLQITKTYKPFFTDFSKHVLNSLHSSKKPLEYEVMRPLLKNGLILNYGKSWQKRRKMITPAFHMNVLENYAIVFNKNIDGLIEELSRHVNKEEFDVFPYAAKCAMDIICETAMGIKLTDNEVVTKYIKSVEESQKLMIGRLYSVWKRFDILFKFTSDYQVIEQNAKYCYDITTAVIKERRKILEESIKNNTNKNLKKVILDILLAGTIDGKPLTNDEIQEEAQTFMLAGHDTTASFISFALYALSNEPDIQEKVYEEIKEIFGNNKNYQPTLNEMNEMHYTERVLKEVHRLYPSVPYIGRKLEEDLHYKDMVIPKNTTVVIPIFCMHRRDDLFPDPEKFDPDRFLSNEQIDKYAYIPFSAGSRICIGYKFAMYEVKCAISKLIMNFKILPCDPKNAVQPIAAVVLESKNGVTIKLDNREVTQ